MVRMVSRAIIRSSSVGTTRTLTREAVQRDVVDPGKPVDAPVFLLVNFDAHVPQALACQAAHARAALAYAAGKCHDVEPLHGRHVCADILADLVAERFV